jgi:aryl-alcohol dehydrogenase-like predicted oxidoreductase
MDYVRLGDTGLKVSRLALGCMSFGSGADWMLDEDASRAIIRRALDGGVNLFDTANIYSLGESEEILARALKHFGVARDQSVIATKLYFPMGPGPNDRGLSRKHVLDSVDASLRRLGTDHIDLLQIHRFDDETPIEETLEALDDVVRAGKARYIGASTMAAWQFAKMQYTADLNGWTRFVSMQNSYSLVYREEEREMLPFCRDQGIGVIPYSPLAGGLLAGSRKAGTARANSARWRDRYRRPADDAVVQAVADVAGERGVSPAQVGLAWVLSRPGVTAPITGATRLEHLDDAFKALDLVLTPDDAARLEAVYEPQAPLAPTTAVVPKAARS